jgi:predicted transposase YbfD/YdcC/GNAT superfamily N-acetyltransferase
LEERGLVKLPVPRTRPGPRTAVSSPEEAVLTALEPLGGEDLELRRVAVRPARRQEVARWRALMARFHYLGDGELVGESLRYIAEYEGRWLALLGWAAAAWKSRHREQFVGWKERQKQARLHLVANNSRFLILPSVQVRGLASRVLSANLRRLSADWSERYGHRILLAETFVDLERFRGTCYRAANWQYLGRTRGTARKGRGYESHGRHKGLFVYPLHRRAEQILSAPFPSPEIMEVKSMATVAFSIDVNRLPLTEQGGLLEALKTLKDPRKPQGIRHPFESVLALAAMATLSGMRSYEAIAEWAAEVPKETLAKLRCWCHQAPSEPTFRRVLQSVDAEEVDLTVHEWLKKQTDLRGKGVALDGKALRGSGNGENQPVHLLAAITHEDGVVVAQEAVSEKTNEIKHAASTLESVDLAGTTVTADAMHTQKEFANFLVDEKEADFIFIAKENQPTLLDDLRTQHAGSFFPSGEHDRQGARENRDPRDLDFHRPGRVSELPPCQDDLPPRSAGLESRRNTAIQGDGVRDHELGGEQ